MREKALSGMMSQCRRRDDDAQNRISQLEKEVARLQQQLAHDSCSDAAVQTTNKEDEVSLLYE